MSGSGWGAFPVSGFVAGVDAGRVASGARGEEGAGGGDSGWAASSEGGGACGGGGWAAREDPSEGVGWGMGPFSTRQETRFRHRALSWLSAPVTRTKTPSGSERVGGCRPAEDWTSRVLKR